METQQANLEDIVLFLSRLFLLCDQHQVIEQKNIVRPRFPVRAHYPEFTLTNEETRGGHERHELRNKPNQFQSNSNQAAELFQIRKFFEKRIQARTSSYPISELCMSST